MRRLAFDVFGTLLDVSAIVKPLAEITSDPESFAAAWRAKQLESTFLLAAMGRYLPFSEVTRRACRSTATRAGLELSEEAVDSLVASWTRLPAFPDVRPALERFRSRFDLAIVSNGDAADLESALTHARMREFFDPVVSAAEVRRFKPARELYDHAVQRLGQEPSGVVLVSSNAFDVFGAKARGLRAVWVNRHGGPLDELGLGPDLEVSSLRDLATEDLASVS